MGILRAIHDSDGLRRARNRRFASGSMYRKAGGEISVDVNETLPDGTTVYLEVPCASNFTPSAGQAITITYPTDSPHGGYAVASGPSAASSS